VPLPPPLGTVTVSVVGEHAGVAEGVEHVTPAGNPADGQVTFTVPVNPPVGVTVIVDA